MAFLPEKHRSSPPQQWERTEEQHPLACLDDTEWRIAVRRRRSNFSRDILCVLCIGAAAWFFWPMIRDALFPAPVNLPYAPPAQESHRGRYAQPMDPVGPNFENWGNRNHSGVVPRDIFNFNRDGGR